MMDRRVWAVTLAIVVSLAACTSANQWVQQAPRAEGYAIDLVDVQPSPGTRPIVGSTVTFKVKAKYSMSIADKGQVKLKVNEPNCSARFGISVHAPHECRPVDDAARWATAL